ncbi:hypothetical protein HGRIS_010525 [Hohenbuehelia grisea]|uniref:Ricin B lectin domain-containing protein n=1 Tax=Hohenbuehelia grisea TaxID=104357 RepID=A0ABR3IXQ2_9AGAR
MRLTHLSTFLALCVSATLADRNFHIINKCPFKATLYINGENKGTLASGTTVGNAANYTFPSGFSGFIYTDLNQGNRDGSGTVRAGFFGTSNYYYIVTDPNWLNVGVDITPLGRLVAPKGGYCLATTCEPQSCRTSFPQPPTRFPPHTSTTPPQEPLYQCDAAEGYRITFCPSGELPNYQAGPRSISPKGQPNKCLDVRGNVQANGTPVQIYDCNGTGAQKWVITRGGQQIKLSGTNYCLDAGSKPASGIKMKIWQCYDNLPAQQWTYLPDDFIRLTNTDQCLDLTDGKLSNSNPVQTWQCAGHGRNQLWSI